ncbi:hypothetical protein LQW54_002725 [Pestalotiopsis sp. IQ-011]
MAETSCLKNLQIDVSVTSKQPPTISATVKNTHPSTVVTILKWESPLDPAALGLGLISITPAGAVEPLRINALKISRATPPSADSLITLGPGESATNVVELREPVVPASVWTAYGQATICLKGRWMAAWPGLTKQELQKDGQKLQGVGAGVGSLTRSWESDTVHI